jgi:hypothetical protein
VPDHERANTACCVCVCAVLYERGLSVCAASRRIIVCPGDEAAAAAEQYGELFSAESENKRADLCEISAVAVAERRTLRADDTFLQQPRPNGH